MTYNDAHRLFLQSFVAQCILEEHHVLTLYTKVCEKYEVDAPPEELSQFIHLINKTLEPLFMAICKGRAEETGLGFYALVNTLEDESAKFASNYTPQEIDYIKRVIERVVLSEEGFVSSIELLNEVHDMQKQLTTQAAQEILVKLVEDGWVTDVNGEIAFGARAIIELGQYVKNKYPEQLSECTLCADLVILGDMCLHCSKKIHKYCAAMTFQSLPANKRKCPSCKELWENDIIKLPNNTEEHAQSNNIRRRNKR